MHTFILKYTVIEHNLHNLSVLVALCLLYGLFTLLIIKRSMTGHAVAPGNDPSSLHQPSNPSNARLSNSSRSTGPNTSSIFTQHKSIFLQVALVSAMNGAAAALYVYMQYFPERISPILIYAASMSWLFVSGCPPIIYLAVNRTLRRECWLLVGRGLPGLKMTSVTRKLQVGRGSAISTGEGAAMERDRRRSQAIDSCV